MIGGIKMAFSGHIVGIVEQNKQKVYSVLLSKYNPGTEKPWSFSFERVPDKVLINALRSGKLTLANAVLNKSGTELTGSTGSLSRFTPKIPINNTPVVIISELRTDDSDRLIGYKIATSNGSVKNIKLMDMLSFCDRITKTAKANGSDAVPVQNCMYVADGDKRPTIRAYNAGQLIVEHIHTAKPKNTAPAKVDTNANKKQISKLEEMFNKAQIEQLRLGKQNGVNIRVYGNNKLSAKQMEAIRKALESGVNAVPFADPSFSADAMTAYALNDKYGVDISTFINPKYNKEQIFEISTAWLEGLDISSIANPDIPADDMGKIRVELETKIFSDSVVDIIDIINRYGYKD